MTSNLILLFYPIQDSPKMEESSTEHNVGGNEPSTEHNEDEREPSTVHNKDEKEPSPEVKESTPAQEEEEEVVEADLGNPIESDIDTYQTTTDVSESNSSCSSSSSETETDSGDSIGNFCKHKRLKV